MTASFLIDKVKDSNVSVTQILEYVAAIHNHKR